MAAAVTDQDCANLPFYTEDLTGENCSLFADFRIFDINARRAAYPAHRTPTSVRAVSLDQYSATCAEMPDFVKIDVEGAELEVLTGMSRILKEKGPKLMVEMTSREHQVVALLHRFGYECTAKFRVNTFWKRKE